MKIIADAGSTKTDWRIIDDVGDVAYSIQTAGINASVSSDSEISHIIIEVGEYIKKNRLGNDNADIYYYGAGCNSDSTSLRILEAFRTTFPVTINSIKVGSDILGAAVALFGDEPGIACVLGTGSASAYFDGSRIIKSVPSLGYILGDEGSGAYLGRELLNRYFKGLLSAETTELLRQDYGLELAEVIGNVYRKTSPNAYLASFASFIINYREREDLKKLVYDGINEFFKRNINRYEEAYRTSLGFVGSLAYFFSDMLQERAKMDGFVISKIIRQPLEEIVKHHLQKR